MQKLLYLVNNKRSGISLYEMCRLFRLKNCSLFPQAFDDNKSQVFSTYILYLPIHNTYLCLDMYTYIICRHNWCWNFINDSDWYNTELGYFSIFRNCFILVSKWFRVTWIWLHMVEYLLEFVSKIKNVQYVDCKYMYTLYVVS